MKRMLIIFHIRKGPYIKYVTLFLANFNPPPRCHTLSHIQGPPKVRHTSRTPQIFSWPSKKFRIKALCTNSLSIGVFCPRGFVRGSFVWKVLSGVVLSFPPYVRIHLLQHKVKHHLI